MNHLGAQCFLPTRVAEGVFKPSVISLIPTPAHYRGLERMGRTCRRTNHARGAISSEGGGPPGDGKTNGKISVAIAEIKSPGTGNIKSSRDC